MKNVGPSESTPEIILKCRHPFLSSIEFEVKSGVCNNGWNYNLVSNVHENHVISRHNSIEHFVLNHNEYKITLKEWLVLKENERKNNWCGVYGKWGAYRPKEEARQIIQGILQAVFELHSHGSHHGFLYHLENFAIQDSELVIDGHHIKIKQVFLTHENQSDNDSQLGDLHEVSNVIFNQILGASTSPNWQIPVELQDLRKLLEQDQVDPDDWKLITNHPSLWHWKSRFSYIERFQSHYVNANPNSHTNRAMKNGFNKIDVSGWKTKVKDDWLLLSVYNHRKNYGEENDEKAEDLLRYFRNVRAHYIQHARKCETKPFFDGKYFDPQFIELKITEVCELFLVKLYSICRDDIKI